MSRCGYIVLLTIRRLWLYVQVYDYSLWSSFNDMVEVHILMFKFTYNV
jgi:hypothetical protein